MFAFQLATYGSLDCKFGNENNSPALMKRKASVSQHMHELVSISRGSNLKTDCPPTKWLSTAQVSEGLTAAELKRLPEQV